MIYCAFCTYNHDSLQDLHSRQPRGVVGENRLIIVINNNRFDFIIRFFPIGDSELLLIKREECDMLFATLVTSVLSN